MPAPVPRFIVVAVASFDKSICPVPEIAVIGPSVAVSCHPPDPVFSTIWETPVTLPRVRTRAEAPVPILIANASAFTPIPIVPALESRVIAPTALISKIPPAVKVIAPVPA